MCDSENHLAAKRPQNPGRKQSKFEKHPKKREIIIQEQESDNNDMSDDSAVSLNNSEEQPYLKVVKKISGQGRRNQRIHLAGDEPNSEEITTLLI